MDNEKRRSGVYLKISHKSLVFKSKSRSSRLNEKSFPFWSKIMYFITTKLLRILYNPMHYTLYRCMGLNEAASEISYGPTISRASLPFSPCRSVHLSPASLCWAAAGTTLLLVLIFPVITQPWWRNGPLKLKGCGVPHLQSKRTPFVHLRTWTHVCYKVNRGMSFPPAWLSVLICEWLCFSVCYFECVCVCMMDNESAQWGLILTL